jgi:tetratricopeptide (TPR) repeat protein
VIAAPGDLRARDAGAPTEPTLQLALARSGLGFELSGPLKIGPTIAGARGHLRAPLTITHARATIVGASFPLDVSGGVDRFRHRRTALQHALISLDLPAIERWLARLTSDLVGPGMPSVRLEATATIDVATGQRPLSGVRLSLIAPSPADALRLDEGFAPLLVVEATIGTAAHAEEEGLEAIVVAVTSAYGVSLATSAIASAGALLGRIAAAIGAEARGLTLTIEDPARAIAMQAFVPRGARLPTTRGVRVTSLVAEGKAPIAREKKRHDEVAPADAIVVELLANGRPAAPSERHARQLEVDRLTGPGDVAFIAADFDGARSAYLEALERAPKHPAICARLAELDADHAEGGARIEAALGWLREAHRGAQQRENEARDRSSASDDDGELGRLLVAATLHERSTEQGRGARSKALSVLGHAAETALSRGVPLVAARAFAKIAALTEERTESLASRARATALDRAIGADPALAAARWMRARDRIALGDDAGALEDLQHLEALARGREARRKTLVAAAELLSKAGRATAAIEAYERALRYTPDDRETVAGLAHAMLAAGESTRGMSLLAHALTRPGDAPGDDSLALDLARAIATHTGDLSAAIARVRGVRDDSTRATLARGLEATWCARVGDAPGATRALERSADLATRRTTPIDDVADALAILRGAANDAEKQGDRVSALRYARGALALSPSDRALQSNAARLARTTPREEPEPLTNTTPRPSLEPPAPMPMPKLSLDAPSTEDSSAEAEAERLLARVKADPDDVAAIDRLSDLLARLGRDFELFALLSARFDDADAQTRLRLAPRQRATLLRLAESATGAGRTSEAELYREAARALGKL